MNGNLLSDGVKTYTYDSANRLIAVDDGNSGGADYTYNGLGDRLTETAPSPENSSLWETKNYTLDLNTGLTQVLSDGTTDYLYGNGRIAQQNTSTLMTDYYLTDALGSVRQMTNQAGAITYARNYYYNARLRTKNIEVWSAILSERQFWIRICMNSGDFQPKIGVNPFELHPFAHWHFGARAAGSDTLFRHFSS